MKALTLTLILSACTAFAATNPGQTDMTAAQNSKQNRKKLDKLMGPGAEVAAQRMHNENVKMYEAAEHEKKGDVFRSQVARGVADIHRESRLQKEKDALAEEKLKIEDLREAAKVAAANFVKASKAHKDKGESNWITGVEAKGLTDTLTKANNALTEAEKEYKAHESAVNSAVAAAA